MYLISYRGFKNVNLPQISQESCTIIQPQMIGLLVRDVIKSVELSYFQRIFFTSSTTVFSKSNRFKFTIVRTQTIYIMSQWLSNASPSFTEFQNYIQTGIEKLNNRVNRMLITWSKSGLKLIIKRMFLKVITSLNTNFTVVFYSDYR